MQAGCLATLLPSREFDRAHGRVLWTEPLSKISMAPLLRMLAQIIETDIGAWMLRTIASGSRARVA